MASKVFISWGGDLSKQLAEEIRKWLPSVLQFVKPYFTPDDIEKGSRWESSISDELQSSNVGIICLTKDNIERPWILFEAGALSKNFGKSKVCTILFDLDSANLSGPLTCFQTTKFEKNDFRKLIETINDTGQDAKLDTPVLNEVFEMWWPRLESNIQSILGGFKPEKQTKRTERELLEEILELSRLNVRQPLRRTQEIEMALIQFSDSLLSSFSRQLPIRSEFPSMDFRNLNTAFADLCSRLGFLGLYDRYVSLFRKMQEEPMISRHPTK